MRWTYMKKERQKHGFSFEKGMIEELRLTPSVGYTNKWDGFLGDTPVSIKTEKLGSDIEMADYFRNAENTLDFILIVGFWQEVKTNIVEVRFLRINGSEWHELFPPKFCNLFARMLGLVTNDYSDDEKWKHLIAVAKKKWASETDNLVRPRFKRDHKSQKRIQCAINNKDFYDYFIPKYEIQKEDLINV